MSQNPASALETTTITHPTPTQDPKEQTVSKDEGQPGQDEGSDWDEDEDHEDVGSSADAPAGAADDDDLEDGADGNGS